MSFSLFDLAARIEKRAAHRRSLRRMANVQNDPHLARDVGLPYRPRPHVRVDQW